MPRPAIFALALLVTCTAADSLTRLLDYGQPVHGKHNETSGGQYRLPQSVEQHASTQSLSNDLPIPPAVVPTPTIPLATTSQILYGSSPLGTMPPSRSPRPSGLPRASTNGTCHGTTVNIVGASLDWWFTETTYTQVDSTFLVQLDSNASSTAWTLLPATETFDVTSAVANPSCASATAFNPNVNATMLQYSCVDTPTPVAAATTTVEQTAYLPINATTSRGAIPNVATSPTPAAITIANANGSSTYAAGTPFVHFSEYDVVSKRPVLYGDGQMGCAETTQVHTLSTPGSFEYTGGDVNGSYAAVAGEIHSDVLRIVGQTDATAGSFVAEPTVVVMVHKVLAAQVMFAMVQDEGAELEIPEATLPPSLSTIRETPTETGIIWSPLAAHIESSQNFLAVPTRSTPTSRKAAATTKAIPIIVPFVAHLQNQDVTLAMPVNPNAPQAVITALFNGATVTATAAIDGNQNPKHVLSAIVKAAQPSDGATQAIGNVIASVIGAARDAGTGAQNSNAGQKANEGQGNPADGGMITVGSLVLPVSASIGRSGLAVVIGGQTALPGGTAITVDGTRISVAPGATAVVIGSSTTHLAPTTNPGKAANIPLITLDSRTWTANAATQYNIAGSTLTPGGTAVAFGSTISLEPSAARVEINGKTQALSPPMITPAPLLTIGGTIYQANIQSTYAVGSQILTRGGQVIASGTTISLPADGSAIVVDGLARPVGTGGSNSNNKYATITAPPVLTLGGKAFAPNGGASYVISGQTLTPGGAITVSGALGLETISLNSNQNKLVQVIAGFTVISAIGLVGAAPGGAPILTLDDETFSAHGYEVGLGATYVLDGKTLTPGGSITRSGTDGPETISLLPEGTAIVSMHAGATTTSSIDGAYVVMPTNAPVLTIAGETFSAINNGATYVIDGQTLTPGATDTVNINGRTYMLSLSPHATVLEIEAVGTHGKAISTVLETLFPAAMPSTTIFNTERVAVSTGTQSASTSHGTSPISPAEDEGPESGSSPLLPPVFNGALGMLSLSVLALLL